jgi:hypothetical protein
MHFYVSDILGFFTLLLMLCLIALVEAAFPLWVEAAMVIERVPADQRNKSVSHAYQRQR